MFPVSINLHFFFCYRPDPDDRGFILILGFDQHEINATLLGLHPHLRQLLRHSNLESEVNLFYLSIYLQSFQKRFFQLLEKRVFNLSLISGLSSLTRFSRTSISGFGFNFGGAEGSCGLDKIGS